MATRFPTGPSEIQRCFYGYSERSPILPSGHWVAFLLLCLSLGLLQAAVSQPHLRTDDVNGFERLKGRYKYCVPCVLPLEPAGERRQFGNAAQLPFLGTVPGLLLQLGLMSGCDSYLPGRQGCDPDGLLLSQDYSWLSQPGG